MNNYNRVVLVGRLVDDPELKTLPEGKPMSQSRLAVNRRYRDRNGQEIDDPTFVDVTFFDKAAEVLQTYGKKGTPLLVEGRLKLSRWQTPEGENRSKLRVVGTHFELLGPKPVNGDRTDHAGEDAYA